MSISQAMQSGVAGLMANSTAVSRISYNIANSDTYGFRRSFAQMLTAGSSVPTGTMEASGVRASVAHENNKDGTTLSTGTATNLAISGNGFFAVTRGVNEGAGEPEHYLTRAGDFQPDSDGYLVNAAGYYLGGFPFDENGSLGVIDRNQYSDRAHRGNVHRGQPDHRNDPVGQPAQPGNRPRHSG